MRALAGLVGVALVGCSASIERPVVATDAVTALEQVTHSSSNELDPSVSPNGTAIAYEVAAPGDPGRVVVTSLAAPSRPLYDSKDTAGREPTWMPDGSGIVFVAKDRLVQTFGQNERRPVFLADVGDPNLAADHPAVSPDGKLVAMTLADVSVRKSDWPAAWHVRQALAVTDLLGSNTKVLGSGTDPAFSPHGRRIAFARASGGREHLFVSDVAGTNARQITDGPADDGSPSWSPHGQRIVFCSVHGDDRRQANLFVVRADGSGLVQLTEGDRFACHPSWSRDGWIYFHANARGRFHVWRMRVRDDVGD